MLPRPKSFTNPSSEIVFPCPKDPAVLSPKLKEATLPLGGSTVIIIDSTLPSPNKTKLLYHVNRTTGNLQLCILSAVTPDVLQIAHGKSHQGFSCGYKIIMRSGYIQGLIRLPREFIWYCPQCLQL